MQQEFVVRSGTPSESPVVAAALRGSFTTRVHGRVVRASRRGNLDESVRLAVDILSGAQRAFRLRPVLLEVDGRSYTIGRGHTD